MLEPSENSKTFFGSRRLQPALAADSKTPTEVCDYLDSGAWPGLDPGSTLDRNAPQCAAGDLGRQVRFLAILFLGGGLTPS